MGRPARISVSLLALSLAALTGCSNMETTAPTNLAPMSAAGVITGHVHGGQQPVGAATVGLYITGTSGYGAGSSLRATTTTDNYGNFSFTKSSTPSDTVASTTNAWACPTTGDPQVYILATGGNTQGPPSVVDDGTNTTTTTYNNPAVGLLAAIGDCASVTNSMFVNLNELTTVASAFALAQYINPGSSVGTETIGTSSSAQGTTGLNNAVAAIANLVSIASGAVVTPPTYTGSGTTAGVTVTATAESAKLITLANTLAACINTTNGTTTVTVTPDATGIPGTPTVTNSTSNACLDLLNSAVPPSPSVTSQPSATFSTASDTIQAAYYMATNPADNGTFYSACHDGGTTNISCLFGLATTQSPFQTGLNTQPSDWTVGVTYTATGTCGSGSTAQPFILSAEKAAVDASGDVYFISAGTTAGANLSEIGPTGAPLGCYSTTTSAAGRGLSIDPTGNVWASFNVVGGPILELPANTTSLVTWPTLKDPYSVVSDGLGNIYYSSVGTGGALYKFTAPGSNTTPTASAFIAGPFSGQSSVNLLYLAADPTNRIWVDNYTNSTLNYLYPNATQTAYTVSSFSMATGTSTSSVTFTTPTQSPLVVVGQDYTLSGFSSAAATANNFNGQHVMVTSVTSTTFKALVTVPSAITSTTTGTEGGSAKATLQAGTLGSIALTNTSYGIAIDSSNDIFNGTTCCASTSYRTVSKIVPNATNGSAATITTSGQDVGGINGVRSLALDGAANIWVGSSLPNSSGATTTGTYSIGEISPSLGSISPYVSVPTTCTTTGCPTLGGYMKADFGISYDIVLDPSGNVWVMNNTAGGANTGSGTSITEIVGAGVPVVTPLSVAAANSKLATKP